MLATGTRLGPYEILGPLGSGGMGDVYRARDRELRRDVALKVLRASLANEPDRLARFRREAQALAALNHPHIGAIYGLETSSGTPALVLELVDGPTLAARIARGPLPIREALTIATQIADGVRAAHEKGIVHRDLKPSNVSLTIGGSVKILDFGLAKLRGADDVLTVTADQAATMSGPLRTAAGHVLGTLAYMSPEQALGQRVDERTDIWAFGCVLYEMLTGQRAFEGQSFSDTLNRIIAHQPDFASLPEPLPDALRSLLVACLEKPIDRRLPRIADASQVLNLSVSESASGRSPWFQIGVLLARPRTAVVVVAAAVVPVTALVATLARFGSNGSIAPSPAQSSDIVRQASQAELIAVLEQRAMRIFARFDASIAVVGEQRDRVGPDRQQDLRAARTVFAELHQRHIAALRANQLVLAEELSREIYHLLFLFPEVWPDSLVPKINGRPNPLAFAKIASDGSLEPFILDYPATSKRDLKVDSSVLERVRTRVRAVSR